MPVHTLEISEARARAMKFEMARHYILKPNLEGGGNNVYGEDIPYFLETVPERDWGGRGYVLMERIQPPKQEGLLMMVGGIYQGSVVSELGILGTCLWERKQDGVKVLSNGMAGWTFKTKPEEVKEMGVVKGYGCFDSPNLIEG